jgi:hypothetical protein
MLRTFLVDGVRVIVSWNPERDPPVYAVRLGEHLIGTVETTPIAQFLAVDADNRPLGTFGLLSETVRQLLREAYRST